MNETLEDILAIAASGQAAAYVLKGCNGWTRKPGQNAKLSDRAMVFCSLSSELTAMQRYLQKRHPNVAAVDYNPGMLLYTFRVTVDQLATLVLEFGHQIHYSVGTTSEPER